MREEYKNELKELKKKMEAAERHAEKIPIFKDVIIKQKLSGEEKFAKYASRYKSVYFTWELSRGFYKKGVGLKMTNHPTHDYSGYYFDLYINTLNLYGEHQEFGLYQSLDNVNIYYTDKLNTTFYIEDEYIEDFLEALNNWYLKALEELKTLRARQKLEKAEKDLIEAKKQLEGHPND